MGESCEHYASSTVDADNFAYLKCPAMHYVVVVVLVILSMLCKQLRRNAQYCKKVLCYSLRFYTLIANAGSWKYF